MSKEIKTLKDFWNNADGVYDFVNKNGVTQVGMDELKEVLTACGNHKIQFIAI